MEKKTAMNMGLKLLDFFSLGHSAMCVLKAAVSLSHVMCTNSGHEDVDSSQTQASWQETPCMPQVRLVYHLYTSILVVGPRLTEWAFVHILTFF